MASGGWRGGGNLRQYGDSDAPAPDTGSFGGLLALTDRDVDRMDLGKARVPGTLVWALSKLAVPYSNEGGVISKRVALERLKAALTERRAGAPPADFIGASEGLAFDAAATDPSPADRSSAFRAPKAAQHVMRTAYEKATNDTKNLKSHVRDLKNSSFPKLKTNLLKDMDSLAEEAVNEGATADGYFYWKEWTAKNERQKTRSVSSWISLNGEVVRLVSRPTTLGIVGAAVDRHAHLKAKAASRRKRLREECEDDEALMEQLRERHAHSKAKTKSRKPRLREECEKAEALMDQHRERAREEDKHQEMRRI